MLGHDVDFGIIYAIMATQSGETAAERRVGNLIRMEISGLDDSFVSRVLGLYTIFA